MSELKNYKSLNMAERKAILIGTIIKRTRGALTKSQIEAVVSNMDVMEQYRINVYETSKKFAEKCFDKDITKSKAGNTVPTFVKQYCRVIVGNVEVGKKIEKEATFYSQAESKLQLPNFSVDEVAVIEITSKDPNFDKMHKEVAIYLPEGQPYKMDKEIEIITKLFDIV